MTGKMLFNDTMGRNFSGLCPNKHGNVAYIIEKNKISNRSVRPIYVALEDNNYFYYFRIQGKNNEIIYNLEYMKGMHLTINKNYLGYLPAKNSILFLDNIYRISKISLYKIIDQKHECYIKTRKTNLIEQKIIFEKIISIINQKSNLITIQTILPNKLLNKPQVSIINNKKYLYNNISKIEYTTLNQLNYEYARSKGSNTFNKNLPFLSKKFSQNTVNKEFLYVSNLFKSKLKEINKEIEKLESENNQKIIRESKPKKWERER